MDDRTTIREALGNINDHLIKMNGQIGELRGEVSALREHCEERGGICRERFREIQGDAYKSSRSLESEAIEASVRISPRAWAAIGAALAALAATIAGLCRTAIK